MSLETSEKDMGVKLGYTDIKIRNYKLEQNLKTKLDTQIDRKNE